MSTVERTRHGEALPAHVQQDLPGTAQPSEEPENRAHGLLDPPIRILAQAVRPATVRSLDAIHLGTALHARHSLTSFVTYDKRLLEAAKVTGLQASSPT